MEIQIIARNFTNMYYEPKILPEKLLQEFREKLLHHLPTTYSSHTSTTTFLLLDTFPPLFAATDRNFP